MKIISKQGTDNSVFCVYLYDHFLLINNMNMYQATFLYFLLFQVGAGTIGNDLLPDQ